MDSCHDPPLTLWVTLGSYVNPPQASKASHWASHEDPSTCELLLLLPPLPVSPLCATQSPGCFILKHSAEGTQKNGAKGCSGQIREGFPEAGVLKPSTSRWREPVGMDGCAQRCPHCAGLPPPTPQEQLPDLNTHFRSQSFHTSMYASSWFLTLFLTTFPLPVATRVFDIFMYEVRTPNTPSSSGGPTPETNPSLAVEGSGLGEGYESSLGEQDQRYTVTAAFAGPGDCVPGGPRPAAGEPDGADAAGHGGHVPGGPGAQGRLGLPLRPHWGKGTWACKAPGRWGRVWTY